MTDTLTVGTVTQLVQPAGRVSWFPPMERNEFTFVVQPDPRDAYIAEQTARFLQLEQELGNANARVSELEAQVAKYRLFPQQVMDAIEQYDWDDERWFIDDIRAIIEGKAGYPSHDDSLWFAGNEWQELLDRAITGSCATRDERIIRLESALVEVRNNLAGHSPLSLQDVLNMRLIDAALMYPESDMSITVEELEA